MNAPIWFLCYDLVKAQELFKTYYPRMCIESKWIGVFCGCVSSIRPLQCDKSRDQQQRFTFFIYHFFNLYKIIERRFILGNKVKKALCVVCVQRTPPMQVSVKFTHGFERVPQVLHPCGKALWISFHSFDSTNATPMTSHLVHCNTSTPGGKVSVTLCITWFVTFLHLRHSNSIVSMNGFP